MLPVKAVMALASRSSKLADILSRVRRSLSAWMFLLSAELSSLEPASAPMFSVMFIKEFPRSAAHRWPDLKRARTPFAPLADHALEARRVANIHLRNRRFSSRRPSRVSLPFENPTQRGRAAVAPAPPDWHEHWKFRRHRQGRFGSTESRSTDLVRDRH